MTIEPIYRGDLGNEEQVQEGIKCGRTRDQSSASDQLWLMPIVFSMLGDPYFDPPVSIFT